MSDNIGYGIIGTDSKDYSNVKYCHTCARRIDGTNSVNGYPTFLVRFEGKWFGFCSAKCIHQWTGPSPNE